MQRPAVQSLSPRDLFQMVIRHRWLWITPMIATAVLAGCYSLVMPRKWKATQGLLIRPEAASLGGGRLGKFSDLSEMKTVQETLLELARSKTVVTETLQKVGPAKSWRAKSQWPTPQDVADFRDAMVMTPPGGAEFGKTEVFYLGVLDKSPERAAALTTSLAEALEVRTKEIRQKQADSMIAELDQGVDQAETELDKDIAKLTKFETSVGADLVDLRNLTNPIGGASESSQNNVAILAEIRANEAERARSEKLLAVLREAQGDPAKFVATPASLLTSQPAVDRLKQGLIEAQLKTARLLGKLAPEHPYVLAAKEAETQVRERLHSELGTAISGLEIELELGQQRAETLQARLAKNHESQKNLARHRAAYAKLVAAVDNQTQLVDAARNRLADAEVHLAGAQSASVLSRIDDVESGLKPVGPGRATIVAAGGLFGMLLGFGLVFVKYGPQRQTDEQLNAVPDDVATPAQPEGGQAAFGFNRPAPASATLADAIATGFDAHR
ncbi:Wzz/FepE/Etk N-terminal domain-containing protein [Aeoliella sp. ICT_H6.2]|uniref:Wzz/FepE/Etk N-terminal domain-containing protein n=1 Tax=Aeoliella straminimaris TaxID=2954799 RepID=A0A9X2JIY4_9BACT|nr:Wzz/FepE/Etk N-terminal domain-containing protein [Aeoliella straminimaris]MCO6047291.1 Wzz/FepE/Etk N-terminal domain-containing protein [Aeoliella straminimaris]